MRFVLIALAAIILASCSSGTEGIFASIEREQKVVSLGGLNKNSTLTHVTEFDGRFYAAGGKALFSRSNDTDAVKWDKETVGGASDVAAVEAVGTRLYAVASGTLYFKTSSTSWAAVSLTTGTAADLIPVRKPSSAGVPTVVTELIVVANQSGSALTTVYRLDDTGITGTLVLKKPAAWNTASNADGPWGPKLSSGISAATEYDSAYYATNESYVWRIASAFNDSDVVTATGLPHQGYSGLLAEDGKLYLSTVSKADDGGGLYVTSGTGTTLPFSTIASKVDDSLSDPVSFGTLLFNDVNNSLWVGTLNALKTSTSEGNGYGEIRLSDDHFSLTPTTNENNYDSTAISTSIVSSFFYSSTNQEYYLGTQSHGLWLWKSSDKTWSQQ